MAYGNTCMCAHSISHPLMFLAARSIAFPVACRDFFSANLESFVPCTLSSPMKTGYSTSLNLANMMPPSGLIETHLLAGLGGGPPALWKAFWQSYRLMEVTYRIVPPSFLILSSVFLRTISIACLRVASDSVLSIQRCFPSAWS